MQIERSKDQLKSKWKSRNENWTEIHWNPNEKQNWNKLKFK